MSRSAAAGVVAGSKETGSAAAVFELTPHKIALCQLIQLFAPPAQQPLPFPFQSISHHNRLGLFLFSLTRSCEDFLEPQLEELLNQLKTIGGLAHGWLCEQLTTGLSSLSSPDDLFNFFDKLRGVISPSEGTSTEDEQIFLDPNSHLGLFLRCCILSFNLLTFEGVCHLLTNIAMYCNSAESTYEMAEDEEFNNESDNNLQLQINEDELLLLDEEDEEGIETSVFDKLGHGFEPLPHLGLGLGEEGSSSQLADPKSMYGLIEVLENNFREEQNLSLLRSSWQIEGYLNQQADFLEKDARPFPLNSFNSILTHLQKLAPEFHRVQYLQYLNSLYHEDFVASLDSLHRYFDYSAGMEGLFSRSNSTPPDLFLGRYESALLCLGTMHCHFGHSKTALEALTEAVRVSQQNNDDSCLAYTLAAICTLLSEIGINSDTIGIIGSPYSLGTSIGLSTPLSAQQQLLVLLKRSIKRADSLKLSSLLSFNRLTLAKFDLKHVKRPLLLFGPKALTKLTTFPVDVCKEIRLSSRVLTDFGLEGLALSTDNGAFSTSWLKNLMHQIQNSPISKQGSRNDYDSFHFHSQPSPIPGSVLQLAGSSCLLRATAWEHFGSAPLVRMNALVYATCFADAVSSSELSLAYIKLIQQLAVFKGYSEALNALKIAEERFASVSKSRIQLLKLQLLHEQALHRGQLKIAQQICDEFGVLASSINGADMEIKTEASLRLARTLLASNQFDQAVKVANSLFCTCYKYNMQIENATVLLLLAEIHRKSGNAVQGLPYALASLSFCKSFNLDLLEASANLTLAELWLCLGPVHSNRALSLVNRSLPMVLGHGGLELRARANIALAKCYLSDPKFSISDDSSIVLEPLSEAAQELQILEYHELAAEAFYLTAMVYNHIGKIHEREQASISFNNHLYALENHNNGLQ